MSSVQCASTIATEAFVNGAIRSMTLQNSVEKEIAQPLAPCVTASSAFREINRKKHKIFHDLFDSLQFTT